MVSSTFENGEKSQTKIQFIDRESGLFQQMFCACVCVCMSRKNVNVDLIAINKIEIFTAHLVEILLVISLLSTPNIISPYPQKIYFRTLEIVCIHPEQSTNEVEI